MQKSLIETPGIKSTPIKMLWIGILRGIKWTLILYSIVLAYQLLVDLGLLIESGMSGRSFRELHLSTPLLGGHGLYTFFAALFKSIPVACLIFSCWEAFLNKQKRVWKIVCPYVIYGITEVLLIAKGLDWNFRIMTVDRYMTYVFIVPVLCGTVQLVHMSVRRFVNKSVEP